MAKNIQNIFMANKITDLSVISRTEMQHEGNLDSPSAICPNRMKMCCELLCESYFFYSHRCTFKIGHIGENMSLHYFNKWQPAFLLLMTSLHIFQMWLVLYCACNLYSCQCQSLCVYVHCLFTVSYVVVPWNFNVYQVSPDLLNPPGY